LLNSDFDHVKKVENSLIKVKDNFKQMSSSVEAYKVNYSDAWVTFNELFPILKKLIGNKSAAFVQMEDFFGRIFYYLGPVQNFTLSLKRLVDFYQNNFDDMIEIFCRKAPALIILKNLYKEKDLIKVIECVIGYKFLFDEAMSTFIKNCIALEDSLYPQLLDSFITFISMDVDSFFKSSLPFDFSEMIDAVDEFYKFLFINFSISVISVQESSKKFLDHMDKFLLLLRSEELDFLFSEEFFINLKELIYFIPELAKLNNKLNSLRDIVEFFALYRKKYEGDLKMLMGDLDYLLKVLKNLKALLMDMDQSKKNLHKEFQQ
jgi:hypothetical protein